MYLQWCIHCNMSFFFACFLLPQTGPAQWKSCMSGTNRKDEPQTSERNQYYTVLHFNCIPEREKMWKAFMMIDRLVSLLHEVIQWFCVKDKSSSIVAIMLLFFFLRRCGSNHFCFSFPSKRKGLVQVILWSFSEHHVIRRRSKLQNKKKIKIKDRSD